ncbi:pentapeptide repeat-containing protein [Methylocystis rosea]|uniref:Pentapeptide repeat-containing protein n=1 Tax=Methylocystis rosea TaxID=173366 RepID=A0A3G8M3H6_9HYPH|nr:pentapeptide repeat-containing protein [Methylocystis rosea]AZG76486.1 pentapeptide repeat-containing protein [Methylocystis rosea]
MKLNLKSWSPSPTDSAIIIFLSLLSVLVGWLGWRLIPWLQIALEDGNVDDINKLLLAVAGVIGVYFLVWRTWIADRQRHVAQEELYTSLLTKAVEQLGATREEKSYRQPPVGLEDDTILTAADVTFPLPRAGSVTKTAPNLEVRLGAIYALEKLARDYLPLHWQIMEILCAYVRTNAGPPKARPEQIDTIITRDGNSWTLSEREAWRKHWSGLKPFVDIQAALTVIGRRSEKQKKYEEKLTQSQNHQARVLDLSNCHLARIDLRGMYFRRANIDGSCLEAAYLEGADLREASFREAQLNSAHFFEALLDGAVLTEAQLSGASLQHASLERAYAVSAKIESTNLVGTNLKGARLDGASFVGSNLESANMEETFIERTDFTGVKSLNQEQLNGAFGDAYTILPDKLTRPARWLESYEGDIPD